MINITKPYLPDREKLNSYIDGIYQRAWLTNNGPLVQELTERLEKYLGVENLLLVSNGTLALQIAYRTLGIKGEAITTPFTFVATASSLVWEGIEPVFVDIDPSTLCMDASKIEAAITPRTSAIVPVHVFGNAGHIEQIETIAHKHGLKTVYDGAHAFGVKYRGRSILSCGDAATLSFHATKLFHTIEGGAVIFKRKEDFEKAGNMIKFGMEDSENISMLGINAKMNEFQAAMGLCVLDEIETIIAQRSVIWNHYYGELKDILEIPSLGDGVTNNYSYFPVLFDSEETLLKVKTALNEQKINPRRYFYPSLDTVNYLKSHQKNDVSQNIAIRVLCLPIYPGMEKNDVQSTVDVIKKCLRIKK